MINATIDIYIQQNSTSDFSFNITFPVKRDKLFSPPTVLRQGFDRCAGPAQRPVEDPPAKSKSLAAATTTKPLEELEPVEGFVR